MVAHPDLQQISEVVNSMKDLMDFCRDQKIGAIGNFFIVFTLIIFVTSIISGLFLLL